MHGLEQVPKGVMRKPVNVKWQKIAKMFTKVLYKTAKILQHYDFALLSKHILIMRKSFVDFQTLKIVVCISGTYFILRKTEYL